MKVVVILPTYNERGNIEKLIPILEQDVFPKIKNHSLYILVCDDSSPDGTAEEVKKLMKKWKNISLNIGEKKGLGAAYARGMDYALKSMYADVIFTMDADFFHDPLKIGEFLKQIDKGYDLVVGTRYSDGGSIPRNWRFDRKIYSIFGNLLVRIILFRFSIHDWTGGYRAMRKKVVEREKDKAKPYTGYTFNVAFLHKAIQDGFKTAEVPFNASDRIMGHSKITPIQYIINLMQYVIMARVKEISGRNQEGKPINRYQSNNMSLS